MAWKNEQRMASTNWDDGNITCPSCGKMLDDRPLYQLNGVRHCSWTCLRRAEQEYKDSPEYHNILMELNGMEATEPVNMRRDFTRDEVRRIRQMAAEGKTVTQIAAACDRTTETMRRKMHQLGIAGGRPGSLTEAQKDAVRRQYKGGCLMKELAVEYSVSISTISKAIREVL